MDKPKSLRSPEARTNRLAAIEEPHVAPLSAFVRRLRERMGVEYGIPYFDPFDGGIGSDCLFLLEAPGPKAIASQFISRNNPDETAKNFFLLTQEAGIDRRRTAIWNVVPWYIGSGKKIRPASATDLGAAAPALAELASLLPSLHSIVLLGKKASTAKSAIAELVPQARIFCVPHPSPVFINRRPGNRAILLDKLRTVADGLPQRLSAK
jgi:hypothetical protein